MRRTIYRLKYRYGKHLPLTSPVDISLELASTCNMHCNYCYHANPKTSFKKGFMTWRTANMIIDQAAKMGVHSLKFNWRGESTLNPWFYRITSFAKELATGSTFIDRISNSNFKFNPSNEDIFLAFCNQTKVKISFDSFNPLVFEKQREGGIHSITLKNIDLFYNHSKRENTEIVIQAVRTKLNKDEDLENEIKKRWPEATASIRDMVGGRIEGDLQEYEDKFRDFNNRQPCLQAFVRLIFDHEGKAFPCCPDIKNQLLLGDIHEEPLYKIFNGKRAKQLRVYLKNGVAFNRNPCANCSSFESFKGYKHPWGS